MAKIYLILSMLFVAPLLQSCSSLSATRALYGVQAMTNIKHSNESAYGYYQLGRHYQAQNRLEAAELAYKKALSVDERFYEAQNALGVVYSMQGRLDLAVEQFRAALAHSPRSPQIQNNLGYAYYLHHNDQAAINALESAAALDSQNWRTLQNLGLAYARAGLADKAEQAFGTSRALRAGDASAVASASGEARSTVNKPLGSVPSSGNERAAVGTAADDVFSKALSARPSPSVSAAAEGFGLGNAVAGIMPRGSDDLTLVLVAQSVYELRDPKSAARTPSAPASRVQGLNASSARVFRLEVSNGNAIPGMARRVGEQLKRSGVNVARLTNQVPYRQLVTEIQYREGYTNEADKLASSLQQQVIVVPAKALSPDIHVRLVLGKDVPEHVALFKLELINDRRPITVAAQLP